AVAEERPDATVAGVAQTAMLEIAVEARLVERRDRSQAHADRGELPEVGHQAGVRIARQTALITPDLAAEVVEVVLGEPALEECPGVDAGRGVALEVDLVAVLAVVLAAEEVVEADLIERRRAGEGGQVAADAIGRLVGLDHHDRGVPTDVGAD